MREFMTKVSDYFNERRNHPERQEDRLAIVIIGVAAAVVIVLLLLVLWGHIAQERRQKEAENENVLETVTYEETAQESMAQNDEELRQEYLANVEYLNDKIAELLAAMTQVEQNLSETIEQYREEDTALQEELSSLYAEVSLIVNNLRETQATLYDLTDIVQVMNEETIPIIREQIIQIQADVDQIHVDIANLYAKVAALEQEDRKLWESIGDMEEKLQAALNQNMTEVHNQFDILLNRVEKLMRNTLQYRYDSENNTLYLEPYQE